MPYQTPMIVAYDSGDFRATMDKLKNKPRYTTEFSLFLSDGNGGCLGLRNGRGRRRRRVIRRGCA